MWAHLVQNGPKTLLVTSVVSILSTQFGLLDIPEQWLLLAAANMVSAQAPAPIAAKNGKITVVGIDDQTFQGEYEETTPLNRCVLLKELREIYAAQPQLVAIDLDISPKVSFAPCQAALYEEIHTAASHGIGTVMLEPFTAVSAEVVRLHESWKDEMRREPGERIRFAHGDIPVVGGLALKYLYDSHSLADVARAMSSGCVGEQVVRQGRCKVDRTPIKRMVDPRAYLNALDVIRTVGKGGGGLTTAVLDSFNCHHAAGACAAQRVVFFGAAYGEDDLFLTPIGRVFGVEAHAVGYANTWILPSAAIVEFGTNLIIGFMFSIFIDSLWVRYFDTRSCDHHDGVALLRRWTWLILLPVGLLAALWGVAPFLQLSLQAVWQSPLDSSLELLLDGLVLGSLGPAVQAIRAGRRKLSVPVAPPRKRGVTAMCLWLSGVASYVGVVIWALRLALSE